MELKKWIINLLTFVTIVVVIVLDVFNVSNYIHFQKNISSILTNLITFLSILLGFVATIYTMIQSDTDSYILNLLRKEKIINIFNKRFKHLILIGFISIILLIIADICSSSFNLLKWIIYISVPVLTRFILLAYNNITVVAKMVIANEELKARAENELKPEDIKFNS